MNNNKSDLSVAADPLDNQQLAELQVRLLSMKSQILTDGAASLGVNRYSDPLDQAQEATETMVQLRRRALDSDLLSEVEKALHKMQIGAYGYCEISGDPIDSRRLMANPVSRTCIEEQEKLEQRQTMERRVSTTLSIYAD